MNKMVQTVIAMLPFDKTIALLKDSINKIQDDGTFFAVCATEYDEFGNVKHDFLEIIEKATLLGYEYVNTIVYPTLTVQRNAFLDNVKYIVWLCKDHSKMKICKDAIREKHIWKDVEWGKREKNYNPKGKDPGNVWIPTVDDGKAHITDHILLSDREIFNRLISMVGCGDNCEIYTEKVHCKHKYKIEQDLGWVVAEEVPTEANIYFKSSESMDEIEDGTVKVVVTSPPYWDLKNYFKDGQIGQESYETYLNRMRLVWSECYRKLSANGTLWVNINIRVKQGKVVLIPRDFVKSCVDIGFFYKGIVIWHKSSGIPTTDKNIVDRHEYVLCFSKCRDFSVNYSIQNVFVDYKNSYINGGAFWNINRKAGSVGKKYIHPAIYPNELVNRIVLMTSRKGETVLDPFLGSGTSLISALRNSRRFVGYEYNEGFQELMQDRFSKELSTDNIFFHK